VKMTPSRNSTRTVPPSPTIGDARVQSTPGITQHTHRAHRVVLHVGKRRCLIAPPVALGVQTSVVGQSLVIAVVAMRRWHGVWRR
jgi:hypothetical protein